MQVQNGKHLAELIEKKLNGETEGQLDCYIALCYGRSSKTLQVHSDKSITVFNEIDETWKEFDSVIDVAKSENITTAIKAGAFHVFNYEI